jgi:hypothetical protein
MVVAVAYDEGKAGKSPPPELRRKIMSTFTEPFTEYAKCLSADDR